MFVVRSMQLRPHLVRPVAQLVVHAALEHTCPAGQAWPHAPQFIGSDETLTQVFPHALKPVAHLQAPAWHIWPVEQAPVHEPQWRASVCRLTQSPPHDVSPPEQPPPASGTTVRVPPVPDEGTPPPGPPMGVPPMPTLFPPSDGPPPVLADAPPKPELGAAPPFPDPGGESISP
jgi:hypothetical protein